MEPFTYRWGPRRLAGLGVRLGPDQVAVTEVPGLALAVQPIYDPRMMTDSFGHKVRRVMGPDDQFLYRPVVVEVDLNHALDYHPESYSVQDHLDEWSEHGEQWRTFAAAATLGDQNDQIMCEDDYQARKAWDMIMVDDEVAHRFRCEINGIWNRLNWEALDEWAQMSDQIRYALNVDDLEHGMHPDFHDRWTRVCATLGISPEVDEDGYGEEPELAVGDYVPDWSFQDPDLHRIWGDLVVASKNGWVALEAVQARQDLNGFLDTHKKEQPWLSYWA